MSSVDLSRIHCKVIHSRPLPKSLTMDRQFPPEIIQLIVKASLARYDPVPYTFFTSNQRYTILKNYSLLNSTWRAFSEPLLYKLVVIESEETALLLLKVADTRGGSLDYVRDFRICGIELDDDARRIFSVVPAVVDLFLYDCAINLDDLAHLKQIRRLNMVNVADIGSSSTLLLPSLRHLSLCECYPSPTAPFIFTRSSLPQLRHLEI